MLVVLDCTVCLQSNKQRLLLLLLLVNNYYREKTAVRELPVQWSSPKHRLPADHLLQIYQLQRVPPNIPHSVQDTGILAMNVCIVIRYLENKSWYCQKRP